MERILEENYPFRKSNTIKCFEIRLSDFHHVLRISIGKGKKTLSCLKAQIILNRVTGEKESKRWNELGPTNLKRYGNAKKDAPENFDYIRLIAKFY